MAVKILAFAGSTRKDSYNKKLVKIAVKAAESEGASVTYIDLRDYPMPLYDGDLESEKGIPESAKKLKELFLQNEGLLIASPEYNSGITAVLKNTIDWVSRPAPGEESLACFKNKVAVLMSASIGALGGIRALPQVRLILSNISVLVLPQQTAISKAHEAFVDAGLLKDAKQQASIENLGKELARFLKKLKLN